MSIFKNFHAIIDGPRENAKDVHEEPPTGDLEEESIADGTNLTLFVQQRFRHEVISVNGECAVVGNKQSRTSRRNFIETLK